MDTLYLGERPTSDHNDEHIQPDDIILKEASSIVHSDKFDSGIESFHTSVTQKQTPKSPSVYESLNATKSGTEENQLNPYTELSSDVWNEIFPCRKQLATSDPNLAISQQTVPMLSENLELGLTDYRTMMKTYISKKRQTSRSYESIIATKPNQPEPYEQLNSDIWNEIFPPRKQLSSAELQCERHTSAIVKQSDAGILSDTREKVEEVYHCIDDYDYIHQYDSKLPEQCTANHLTHRPLPGIPPDTCIYNSLNTITRKSICKRRVSRRKCVMIGGFTLALIVIIVVVVFLAVHLTKRVLTKQVNETTVTESPTESPNNIFDARSFLADPILLEVIDGIGSISGITVLGTELFIVRGRSSQVYVYNTNNFSLTRNLNITGSMNLANIVASAQHNCLYISDTGLNVVHRYNLSNNAISKWNVGEKLYGLSLTKDDNVLVSLFNNKQLQEYTPEGSLVENIILDSSIEGLWHSIKLSNDSFILCHGNNTPTHRVCMVDQAGRIINSYGGVYGAGVRMLNKPEHLALDGYNNVIVVEQFNNRIMLLSPELTHLGYIEIPITGYYQLEHPWGLHLDKLGQRLYVGEDTPIGKVYVLAVPPTISNSSFSI